MAEGLVVDLTATPDRIERHPAVSPDGRWLAYALDGAVSVAPLSEVTR